MESSPKLIDSMAAVSDWAPSWTWGPLCKEFTERALQKKHSASCFHPNESALKSLKPPIAGHQQGPAPTSFVVNPGKPPSAPFHDHRATVKRLSICSSSLLTVLTKGRCRSKAGNQGLSLIPRLKANRNQQRRTSLITLIGGSCD